MQAIVLAGGFGIRLKSVTEGVAKPMAPVAGRPFLSWLLAYMQRQGVTDTMLCLHHLHDAIPTTFGARFGNMRLRYSVEKRPLGTGGAIACALRRLNPPRPVLVLHGDALVQLDYQRMYQAHLDAGRRVTLASAQLADCSRYSRLTRYRGRVVEFDTGSHVGPGDINTGFYVVSPSLFDGYPMPAVFSFEHDFLAPYTSQLQPALYDGVTSFIDVGAPKGYLQGQRIIPEQLGRAAA